MFSVKFGSTDNKLVYIILVDVIFDIVTAVTVKITVHWDVTPCNLSWKNWWEVTTKRILL
jgi:hypothetical protein